MNLYTTVEEIPDDFSSGAIAIGNFDGVHRGHAQLIKRLVTRAKEFDGPAVVFTFDPHPVQLLRPDAAPVPLTWVQRKADLLSELGVDTVIAYPTNKQFLSLSPKDYFAEIVVGRLGAKSIVEGPNFFFGKDRAGNTEVLRQLCGEQDVALEIVTPIESGDGLISSSRIRRAIANGDLRTANDWLTRPYRTRGIVEHGAGRGSKIGFPTANLTQLETLLPGLGVYAGVVFFNDAVGDRSPAKAAINIGPNPTFDEQSLKVEVHILDFDQSIYGEQLEIEFHTRLRAVQNFGSLEELQSQLKRDIAATRESVNLSK